MNTKRNGIFGINLRKEKVEIFPVDEGKGSYSGKGYRCYETRLQKFSTESFPGVDNEWNSLSTFQPGDR